MTFVGEVNPDNKTMGALSLVGGVIGVVALLIICITVIVVVAICLALRHNGVRSTPNPE